MKCLIAINSNDSYEIISDFQMCIYFSISNYNEKIAFFSVAQAQEYLHQI